MLSSSRGATVGPSFSPGAVVRAGQAQQRRPPLQPPPPPPPPKTKTNHTQNEPSCCRCTTLARTPSVGQHGHASRTARATVQRSRNRGAHRGRASTTSEAAAALGLATVRSPSGPSLPWLRGGGGRCGAVVSFLCVRCGCRPSCRRPSHFRGDVADSKIALLAGPVLVGDPCNRRRRRRRWRVGAQASLRTLEAAAACYGAGRQVGPYLHGGTNAARLDSVSPVCLGLCMVF